MEKSGYSETRAGEEREAMEFRAARPQESLMKLLGCSACAGNYEDPGWSSHPEGDEEDDEGEVVNNVEEREQE